MNKMNNQDIQMNEITAMQNIYNEIKNLDDDEKQRVVEWLIKKLGSFGKGNQIKFGVEPEEKLQNDDFSSFESLADLFALANVKTDQNKVLLASSYLQIKQNLPEIASRDINKELQNLGYKVSNITSTISGLMNKKPQLMIQTRKEGKSQQAQKKYKVTTEGINTAKRYLASTENIPK